MEGEVAVAGGWEFVQSKGWSLRAWSLAWPSQGNWAPAKRSGSLGGSGSSSTGVSSLTVWWDLGQTHSRRGGRGRKDRWGVVQLMLYSSSTFE